MKIAKDDMICGQPAAVVRDLLNILNNGYFQSIHADYFSATGMSLIDTQRLILALHEEGYLEQVEGGYRHGMPRDSEPEFPFCLDVTEKGLRIACMRFGKRMQRRTLESIAKTVTDRARLTSTTDVLAYEVTKVWVFGSYLDASAPDYGDLDLVIETRLKPAFLNWSGSIKEYLNLDDQLRWEQVVDRYNEWEKRYRAGDMDCAPPRPDQYYREYYWDRRTAPYFLKRRNHRISIHSMSDFERLETAKLMLLYDADAS